MLNNLKSAFLTAAALAAASPAHAEITSVATMKAVEARIVSALEKTEAADILVGFDIDMTLTQPDHPAVYYPGLKKYWDDFKAAMENLSPEQKDLVNTFISQLFPQRLVEDGTPAFIRALQKKGIKVIAFTAALTGQFSGLKTKVIFLRRDQLQKRGLDFSKSFKNFTTVASYMDFPKYAGWYPMFYHGILSTNGERRTSKGETLVAFLKHVGASYQEKTGKAGYHPKVIILVDDRLKNLKDVEDSLKSYDSSLPFIGLEYQGAFSYAPQEISQEDFQKFWKDLATKAKAALPSSSCRK